MFENIPDEMKSFRQWVVWKLVEREGRKPTKIPLNPNNGFPADVNDPSTWSDFATAVAASSRVNGIGFVLTANDEYGFIDLDDTCGDVALMERQIKIYNYFNSYSELSPSGKGLHIIIKGKLPVGRRRDCVEIYSQQRFMTMTGNVYNNIPIQERQGLFDLLFNEMGGPPKNYWVEDDKEQKHTDDEVIAMASSAANGHKFVELLEGHWEGKYPSQSEADFAFVDIVAFYTQNKAQIARLFKRSVLGQQPKDNYKHRADRTRYVEYMVNKSFDRQLPPLDLDGIRVNGEALRFGLATPSVVTTTIPSVYPTVIEPPAEAPRFKENKYVRFPPGLVGEIAEFILEASPRRVPIVSLAGAFGAMCGVAGRAYNVNGAGLNLYLAMIANTGSGKEILTEGIYKLFKAVEPSLPNIMEFRGPGQIASAQGLVRWLEKKPCVLSTISELGLELARLANPKNGPNEQQLQLTLLKLYHRSGFGNVYDPHAYADVSKNIGSIVSPSFSLLGESTPTEFYGNLNENMISRGLLPRFLIFEHKGRNPYLTNGHKDARPSISLVEKFGALGAECLRCQGFNQVRDVQIMPDADKHLRDLERHCTDITNESSSEISRQLWNRVHLKTLKLAAIIAVGLNYLDPRITLDVARYASDITTDDANNLLNKFSRGDVGLMINQDVDEYSQIQELGRVLYEWFFVPGSNYRSYKMTPEFLHSGVVLANSLQMKLYVNPKFKKDRYGPTAALKKALQYFIDADDIAEIPRHQMKSQFGTIAKAYALKNMARFEEFGKTISLAEN